MNTKYKHTQIEHFQCKAIKKGDKLFLPVTFDSLLDGGQVSVNTPAGYKRFSCFSFIIPEPAPKYDPNRLFREGDEVRYVPCNGRECPAMPCDEYYREKTLTVVKDEDSNHQVLVRTQDGREKYIRFCYLQLVTPVEELEPYCVRKYSSFYAVEKYNNHKARPATYDIDFHPHAKEAAEAERDRLNLEYRRRWEND